MYFFFYGSTRVSRFESHVYNTTHMTLSYRTIPPLAQRNLFAALLVMLLTILPSVGEAAVYLTRDKGDGSPDNRAFSQFHCSDTIYAVIQGTWPAGSSHLIEAYWTDPQGKQREMTRLRFEAVDGITRAWVWLRLHPGDRDLFDRLMMEEDTSMQVFVGEWKLVFNLDSKTQRKARFQVSC